VIYPIKRHRVSENKTTDFQAENRVLPDQSAYPRELVSWKKLLILWPLFFLICFGLGYPTLTRYDPRKVEGLSDTPKYYALVTGGERSAFNSFFQGRLLVPFVARPFYRFAQSHLLSWDPAFFGLLVSNSMFCAATVCLLICVGTEVLNDLSVALLGGTLYLLNFAVPNLQLVGLIDAGESCFMAAVLWSLLRDRWYLLPVWGVWGALAKETFVPFASVFVLTWWLVQARPGKWEMSRLKWIVALGITGLATVMTTQTVVVGTFRWPWEFAVQARANVGFLSGLWRCLSQPGFWYVFAWLLPLGIWRLRYFPAAWIIASISTGAVALILGAFNNSGGTIGRSVFSITGPLLSLSVAFLIARSGQLDEVNNRKFI